MDTTTDTTDTAPRRFVTLREASAALFGHYRYLDRLAQSGRPLPGVHRVGWAYVVELDVLAEAVRAGTVGRTRRVYAHRKHCQCCACLAK